MHPPEMGPATYNIPTKVRPTVNAWKSAALDLVKYLRHPISVARPQVQITSMKNTCPSFPFDKHSVPPAMGHRIVMTFILNEVESYSNKHKLTINTPTMAPIIYEHIIANAKGVLENFPSFINTMIVTAGLK